ncbi:MAG: phytase [Alphaproteobacteria bacterium]|nr:phytase [Alphaproteobacteria bacterium]
MSAKSLLACAALSILAAACAHAPTPDVPAVPVVRETPPVGMVGDAADDPAIWVAANAADSRVIGTQKKGGYFVYDLAGAIVQEVALGLPNNVDLAEGFAWADGAAPIVAASDRADNTIPLFRFNTAAGKMETTPRARVATGFAEVYGVCVGTRGADTILVATSKIGEVKAWRLAAAGAGVNAEVIASYALGSIAEGCVIDGAANAYYVGQELRGVWRVALDDATGAQRVLVDEVGKGRLIADVEGVTLWEGADGGGYIVVSVQGWSIFNVYDRAAPNAFRGAFRVGPGPGGDAVTGTDGIAVSSANLGADFPRGLIVVQDDVNSDPDATQNFKYASWADVAKALGLD